MRYIDENGKLIVRSTLLSSLFRQHREVENKALWLLNGGEEENDKILLGSLAHCILFEPDTLDDRFAFYEGDKRSRSFKNSSFYHKDKTLVPEKLYKVAKEMVESLTEYLHSKAPDRVRKMVFGGLDDEYLQEKEMSVVLPDHKETIKPDALCSTAFLDYKTTALKAVDSSGWREHLMQYNMHLQLGFYYKVLSQIPGYNIDGAYHLVQSTVAPYAVSLFFFPRTTLEDIQEDVNIAKAGLMDLWEEMNRVQTISLCPVLNFAAKDIDEELEVFLNEEGGREGVM